MCVSFRAPFVGVHIHYAGGHSHHTGTTLARITPTGFGRATWAPPRWRNAPTRWGRVDVVFTTLARNAPTGSGRVKFGLRNGKSFR